MKAWWNNWIKNARERNDECWKLQWINLGDKLKKKKECVEGKEKCFVLFFIILKVARAGINTAEGKKVKKNQKNVGGSEEESKTEKQIDFNQGVLEASEAFMAKRMMGKSNIDANLVKRRMHRKTHLSHRLMKDFGSW